MDDINLMQLNGANGFRIDGAAAYDRTGGHVAAAGDVNGDGIDDILIGMSGDFWNEGGNQASQVGHAWVVFGSTGGFGDSLALSALDGTTGFRMDGVKPGDFETRVAGVGDVNGDGIDDILIGSVFADPGGRGNAGESYVVFGLKAGFGPSLVLSALNGANGFRLPGLDAGDQSGLVSGAGDVNGDGIDDILITAGTADPGGRIDAGESYVVFGSTAGFGATVDFASLNGTNGFRIDGIDSGDYAGSSIAGVGDVNGDGVDDILVGAVYGSPGGRTHAGESYVVFGSKVGFGPTLQLSALNGANGFRLDGIDAYDEAGWSVAGAGDVNGDGIDDLLVGSWAAEHGSGSSQGETYVVFGSETAFPASLALSTLNGANGFRIDGIDSGDYAGAGIAAAGDVNGDGIDDILVGAWLADPDGRYDAGESYIVYGSNSGFAPVLSLAALDGGNGYRLDGIDAVDYSGLAVSGAGDVNGDGFDDFLIGARTADPGGRSSAGETYVVFGAPDDVPPGPAFRVEAEDFTRVRGFGVCERPIASGGAIIETKSNAEAVARHVFAGADGVYDLAIGHYDENDGEARMKVYVNGVKIDDWLWDKDLGASGMKPQTLTEREIADVELRAGDVIELRGFRDGGREKLRTDYVDFTRVGDIDDTTKVGLIAHYFITDYVQSLDEIDFDAVPTFEETVHEINRPWPDSDTEGSFWDGGPLDYFAARYFGSFTVPSAGEYTFWLQSDDGSTLDIDGARVIDHDGLHAVETKRATVSLDEGSHSIELRYFEWIGGAVLDLDWAGPGFERTQMTFGEPTAPERLFFDNFSSGALSSDWTVLHPYAFVGDGWLNLRDLDGGTRNAQVKTHDGDPTWTDYSVRMKVDFVDVGWLDSFTLNFRIEDFDTSSAGPYGSGYSLFAYGPSGWEDAKRNHLILGELVNGAYTEHVRVPYAFSTDPFEVIAAADGGHIRAWIDGEKVIDFIDPTPLTHGGIALDSLWELHTRYDDVEVVAGTPEDAGWLV